MKKKKRSLKFKICMTVLGIFLMINIVWLVITIVKWKPYCDAVGYNSFTKDFTYFEGEVEDGRYIYYVALPAYLSWGGNLSLTKGSAFGSDEPAVGLLIFPREDGYEIHVEVDIYDMEEGATSIVSGGGIWLNEKMEFYNTPSKEEQEFFDTYKDKIEHMYDKMYEMWGIG